MSMNEANWIFNAGLLGAIAASISLILLLRMRKGARSLPLSVSAVLLLTCLGLALFAAATKRALRRNALQPHMDSNAEILARMETGGRIIGEYLVHSFPDSKVAVVLSPPHSRDPGEQAMANGLVAATDSKLTCVMVPMDRDKSTESSTPWYEPELYDRAFTACDDCRAVVTLAGLPARLADMRFWRMDSRPQLIVANAQVLQLRKLVADGQIAALLVRRPWRPGDPATADKNRWLLVTTGTVDAVADEYPSLFAGE